MLIVCSFCEFLRGLLFLNHQLLETDSEWLFDLAISSPFSVLTKCLLCSQEKKSLYGSADELKSLITQVLSWDIRSMSQRNKPQDTSDADSIVYHLVLEGLDVSYMIDNQSNILVQDVSFPNNLEDVAGSWSLWRLIGHEMMSNLELSNLAWNWEWRMNRETHHSVEEQNLIHIQHKNHTHEVIIC